ncbi:class I fructose-bisphosphate aldolase, partial [Pseudomonas sp.]|uniref:class I fructose-bisphosphate aldolase n=1 Tax=Pseudomonas sp. TaxID=306 RepID=UPI003CC53B67
PQLGQYISGAILFEETLFQHSADGTPFVDILKAAGIVTGIKVDAGAQPLAGFAGERITEGLDGLRERLQRYAAQGARFAKWRAVIAIGDGIPSRTAIEANAQGLARYAALCQEAGLVPIVEPEVLMDGDHSLARCQAVTGEVLDEVFTQLHRHAVLLEGMLLKPNMVVPGQGGVPASVEEVAQATVQTLRRKVPAAVGGIAFLSGGQSSPLATAHLNAMHQGLALPWPLTFSYGRALQDDALRTWAGDDANRTQAQQALLRRAQCNGAAALGQYSEALEAV